MGIYLGFDTWAQSKMKRVAAFAAVAAASQVNAFDPEFMRGAQTGMFITSEDQFEDYSCPAALVSPQMQTYIDMAKPMQMMIQNMNQNQPMPGLEIALEFAMTAGKVMSVFSEDYDGGEFCKGLLFSKEASKVVFKIGNYLMTPKKQEEIVEKKSMALESKLRK